MQVRLVENLWIGLSINVVVISTVRREFEAKDLKKRHSHYIYFRDIMVASQLRLFHHPS